MRILIKGARILDPGRKDTVGDVVISEGVITAMGPGAAEAMPDAERVVDAAECLLVPGLVDMHVHLREPGQEHKETIASGCRAAARGGFTAVCPMPNTDPPNDSPKVTDFILQRAAAANGVRVLPVAAITRGLAGEELTDFGALKAHGAVAVSDDGQPVSSGAVMQQALETARDHGLLVISHSEDLSFSAGGHMNAGNASRRMGVSGIPNAAEFVMVARDISLCEITGARLHIAHVSTQQSVLAIRRAKERGVPVSAETAPHYLFLTDQDVEKLGTDAKMSPPLRSEADRMALREALSDGTIDAIATDHAPHSPDEKVLPFEQAPNGVIGLETSLGLGLQLVREGVLDMTQLVEKMSCRPAGLMRIDRRLAVGAPADLTVIDPAAPWTVRSELFASRSRNTPFAGWRLPGRAVFTMAAGRVVFDEAMENDDPEQKTEKQHG